MMETLEVILSEEEFQEFKVMFNSMLEKLTDIEEKDDEEKG